MDLHFTNLLIVVAAGFTAPLALGFVPGLRLPSVVLELIPVILLASLFVIAVVVGLTVVGVEHSRRVRQVLVTLQDTTAQIRIRGAFVLLIGFVALAASLGLEVILGAFMAGALLSLIDRDG